MQTIQSSFKSNVAKMDALLGTLDKCFKISERGLRNIDHIRKTFLGKEKEGQNYMLDLQHALDETQCIIDSEKDEFSLDLIHIYDGY